MKDLVLVIQENYDGTYTVAEPVDREYWGVDYMGISEGATVEEAKAKAKEKLPDYRLSFQYN